MLVNIAILLLNSVLANSKIFQISMPLIKIDLNQSFCITFENSLSGNYSNMFFKGNHMMKKKIN